MSVSIVCTSYNYERYIKHTINSVLNQYNGDWEMVIVDDGSSDNSVKVIEDFAKDDSRIKLYTHENHQNKGIIESLRLGVSKASHEWIIFLESDDMIKPEYITEKLRLLEKNPELDMIFSGIEILGTPVVAANFANFFHKRNVLIKDGFKIENMLEFNFVPTFSCVMIKKSVFESLNFDTPMPQNLDWWLWAQVLSNYKCAYLNKELTVWRMHDNSYISTVDKTKMLGFKKNVFDLLFAPMGKGDGKNILNAYLFLEKDWVNKYFHTLATHLRFRALNALNKINKCKPDFYYYEN